MKLPFRLLALPAVISVLALQLTGCSEGGNNLVDPVAEQINTITTCDGEKDLCISGQFIDEPVVGLNYSCNQVQDVTDKDGIFTCPNNSVVTFYLQAEKGKHRITLGLYRIKAIGSIGGTRQNGLLQVTPKDLLTGVSAQDAANIKITSEAQVANILRLLQVMDNDGSTDTNVLNRIVISDTDKSQIDLLKADFGVSLFADTANFEKILAPLLGEIAKKGRILPTAQVATARFNQSLPILQAGVYEVSPFITGGSDKAGNRLYTGMVGETTQSLEKAFEGIFFIIDRDAKAIGLGLEWRDTLNIATLDNTLLQKVVFDKAPAPLTFASQDVGFDITGNIKPDFKLFAENGDTIEITQGVMTKGNLLGNDFFYRNVYGLTSSDTVDVKNFGKWRRTGTLALEGTTNMSKIRDTSPYFDGAIWKTKANSPTTPVFPLHLKLTLRDSDTITCKDIGCPVGVDNTMGISILENGNIITDINNNCRPVNNMVEVADPNQASDLLEEHRLGLVSAVFQDATTGPAISPIIMVDSWAKNDPKWKNFYGMFMGVQSGAAGGPKVQINIARVLDKIVTIENQKDDQEAGSGVAAIWTNYIKMLTAFSTKPAEKQTLEANKAQGYISNIEVQDCNTFLK